MHQFVRNLVTEWRRLVLPFANGTVLVAVSGGADSVSLLLAIRDLQKRKKLDHRIVAAHFNHRLRGVDSDGDEEFVRELTSKLGIELAIGHGSIADQGNLEQNARLARYDFLRNTAERLLAFAVVTGHTVNDQAETVLMNLIRGSGPEGLCGMKPIRALDEENIREKDKVTQGTEVNDSSSPSLPLSFSRPLLVRPLLRWAKRIDTEAFCRDCSINYRYDTMNEDTAFKRVRIRKILLPLLEDMNPRIIETVANTATLMQGLISNSVAGSSAATGQVLSLTDLRSLPAAGLGDAIRTWLRTRRGTTRQLHLKHIKAVERLVLSSKSGRTAQLPSGRVIKTAGKLVYEENKVEN